MNYNQPSIIARPAKRRYGDDLVRFGERIGMPLRPYDPQRDHDAVPRTFLDQPQTQRIIEYRRRILAAQQAGKAVPQETLEYGDSIFSSMYLHTVVATAAIQAALNYRGSCSAGEIVVQDYRTKSIESFWAKIGRRDSEMNDNPITDYAGVRTVMKRPPNGIKNEARDRQHVRDELNFYCEYFNVPNPDEAGSEPISSLGNADSHSKFDGGLQAKLRLVLGKQVIFFEVQGFTESQFSSVEATHDTYHDPARRAAYIDHFDRMIQEGKLGDSILRQSGVIYGPALSVREQNPHIGMYRF